MYIIAEPSNVQKNGFKQTKDISGKMKTMLGKWVNQSFDTGENEAVKHWRWTENKHAPLTLKQKKKESNKKIGGCKKKRINKIKYLQKSLKLASVITRKITDLTETEDVLNNSLKIVLLSEL